MGVRCPCRSPVLRASLDDPPGLEARASVPRGVTRSRQAKWEKGSITFAAWSTGEVQLTSKVKMPWHNPSRGVRIDFEFIF
ncbi:hypothetical protein NC651_016101 [Populus alba x Populus x berolinensis]|nr:hypothetical protein NC651_016098 [Populus alba x Populus x berolinensis]KAJ6913756.1 hypothetical protein NC651_016101 [Populus alba x Populus x berolinensis]